MGLTQEEIIKRAQDKRVLYIKNKICDKNGDKPYVFISYKSDDWETVLGDIVYRLVKEYGLRVYFDGSFDSHASLWINQFPANMKDHKCKGVLAFVDDLYSMSYATLLELMCSKRKLGKEREVVPINIGKITEKAGVIASADTGLGKETYEDGTKNVHAQNEKELFDLIFNELVERKILVDAKYVYGKYAREETLTKGSCSEIIVELLRHFEKNDNPYSGSNADLSGIVDTIKDAFGEEVFGEPDDGSDKNADPSTTSTATTKTQKPGDENDTGISEPTSDQVTIKPDGKICSYGSADKKYYAFYYQDEAEKYTILRGSRIVVYAKLSDKVKVACKERMNENNFLLCDITGLARSTAAKIITGNSTAGDELESDKNILKNEVVVDLNSPMPFEPEKKNKKDKGGDNLPPKESLNKLLNDFMDKYSEEVQGRKVASTEAEKEKYKPGEGNWMYDMVCKDIPAKVAALLPLNKEKYECKSSVGRGGWADCPWVAVFNKYITQSTQQGIYVVYLLNPKMKELYLTLNQGTTQFEEMANEIGTPGLRLQGYKKKEDYVFAKIKESTTKIRGEVETGQFSHEHINMPKEGYALGCVCSKKYTLENLPADESLIADLREMLDVYDQYYELHKNEYPSTIEKGSAMVMSTADGKSVVDKPLF